MSFTSGWLVRVIFRAFTSTQEVVNVIHYESGDSAFEDPGTLQDLADRVRDDCMTAYRACFRTDWTVDPIVVQDELDPLDPAEPRSAASAGPGGAGTVTPPSDPLTAALTCVARKRTDRVGRWTQGRFWCPPALSEADLAGNSFAAGGAYLNRINAWLASIPLEPDIVTGSSDPTNAVVYSRTRRAASLDPYYSDITGFTVDPTVRWLRSRQPGN